MATKCVIQLSYAIGVSQPLSIFLNTFNSNNVPESKIIDSIFKSMDLSPSGIIKHLNLQNQYIRKLQLMVILDNLMGMTVVFLGKKTDLIEKTKTKYNLIRFL